MRIEDITIGELKKVAARELYNLRLRCIQLYGKNFKWNNLKEVGDLKRKDLMDKYKILIEEMKTRGLSYLKETALDRAIFKRSMLGLDAAELGEQVIVDNYVSVGGSFVRDPKAAEDVDIIIRDIEGNRDEGMELKLSRAIADRIKKEAHFVYAPKGPHSSYIPLFDLILRNKPETKIIHVKEAGLGKAEICHIKFIGTGALKSPRKDESLLVHCAGYNVLIDAGPDIQPKDLPNKLDHLLVCDLKSDFMKDAKRIADHFGIEPKAENLKVDDLEIERFSVKHTKHTTYGYRILAKGQTIVYAPEFYEVPVSELKGADIAILEGSAWMRPITFAGKVGGHAAILRTAKKLEGLDIGRVIFTHIGAPVERHLNETEDLRIEIARDGQIIELAEKLEKAKVQLGRAFTPLKSQGGYGKYEFASIDSLWTTWAQGYIPNPGLAIETKIDGFRVQIHKDGESVKIVSEDAKRDLSDRLEDLVKEIQSIKSNCILDGELTIWEGEKKIERKDMPSYVMAKEPPGDFMAKIDVFDCLLFEDSAINEQPWTERQESLDKVFAGIDELRLIKIKPTIAKSEKDFKAAVRKHSAEKHSEGAMIKVINSDYPLKGSTPAWAKFKNFKEIRCKIKEKEAKEGGGWIYTCEIQDGTPIGRTYATKISANVGDILEIAAAEIKYDEEKDLFTWDNPIVRSKKPAGTALTTKEQAKALSRLGRTRAQKADGQEGAGGEFGNIDFKLGDKGRAVVQVHIMGLDEDELEDFKAVQSRAMVARGDLRRLESILKSAIGEHGAHLDFRFQRSGDNYWEGNEIMIGNLSGLSKIYGYTKGQKLRSAWKQSRAGETKTEIIRGPLGWMKAGQGKPEIFEPGEPGATANQYGAMLMIDSFSWEIYLADEHAKKFHFDGGRHFNGNWLWAYIPVGDSKRVWMASQLDPDDHTKTEKKLSEAQRKECDEETEQIRENRKKAKYPHKFKPAKYTHPNGHPRCILCGQEEDIDGDCKDPEKPYFKFIKINKKQQIVGGVVYAPDAVDAQGDYTDAHEIERAMYRFMEKYAKDPKRIKLMHKGEARIFPVLESFQPEEPTKKGNQTIPAGAWYLSIKITDPEIWSLIEAGKVTGFSMGGRARA